MTRGLVESALAAASASDDNTPSKSDYASLESLMAFAASPVVLDELELGMATQEIRARVRRVRVLHQPALRPLLLGRLRIVSSAGFPMNNDTAHFILMFRNPCHRYARQAFGWFSICSTMCRSQPLADRLVLVSLALYAVFPVIWTMRHRLFVDLPSSKISVVQGMVPPTRFVLVSSNSVNTWFPSSAKNSLG